MVVYVQTYLFSFVVSLSVERRFPYRPFTGCSESGFGVTGLEPIDDVNRRFLRLYLRDRTYDYLLVSRDDGVETVCILVHFTFPQEGW